MVHIQVGYGSALMILELDQVPETGDKITIQRHQIKRAVSDQAYLKVGHTFVLTRGKDEFTEYGTTPYFSIENT